MKNKFPLPGWVTREGIVTSVPAKEGKAPTERTTRRESEEESPPFI